MNGMVAQSSMLSDWVSDHATEWEREHLCVHKGPETKNFIPYAAWSKLPLAMQLEILHREVQRATGHSVSFISVQTAMAKLKQSHGGKRPQREYCLGKKVLLKEVGGFLYIAMETPAETVTVVQDEGIRVRHPKGWKVTCTRIKEPTIFEKKSGMLLTNIQANCTLTFRLRETGDVMVGRPVIISKGAFSQPTKRNLGELMRMTETPLHIRDFMPVIQLEGHVIAIYQLAATENHCPGAMMPTHPGLWLHVEIGEGTVTGTAQP
jgi:hypothetical protein